MSTAPRPTKLREARKRAGMSQEYLAQLLGISTYFISHWETGKQEIWPFKVPQLCQLLEVTPDMLAGREEMPARRPPEPAPAPPPPDPINPDVLTFAQEREESLRRQEKSGYPYGRRTPLTEGPGIDL